MDLSIQLELQIKWIFKANPVTTFHFLPVIKTYMYIVTSARGSDQKRKLCVRLFFVLMLYIKSKFLAQVIF